MIVRYLCKVYAPMVRASSVLTVNHVTPEGALARAFRAIAEPNPNTGRRLIELDDRQDMRIELFKYTRDDSTSPSRQVQQLPRDLSRVHTLA